VKPWKAKPDVPLSPRMPARMARDAVNKVVTEMYEKGALDAGNGDVLDAWLDSVRPQWIAHHVAAGTESQAAAQLAAGELEAVAAAARHRADAAKAERDGTQRQLAIFEQRLVEPNEAPAMEHADRRRRPRPSLDALEGLTPQRGWWLLSVGMLLLAAAGDFVNFYMALAGLTEELDFTVWILTGAFAAAAVGVMHVVGRTARNLREGQGGLGRTAIAVMTLGWAALGAAAFYVRTQVTSVPASTGGDAFGAGSASAPTHSPLLQAVLLAALYVAAGILAFSIGFSEHHPRMKSYLSLQRRLAEQQEGVARAEEAALKAQRLFENARDEVARTAARTAAAEASVEAEIAELKELARIHVAGLLGEPAATNNLITGRSDGSSGTPPKPDAGALIARQSAPLVVFPVSMNGNGHHSTPAH
jgi:hypothetical protein